MVTSRIRLLISILILLLWETTSVESQQWAQTSGPKGGYVYSLKRHPSGKIFAGTTSGVYMSSDGGINWTLSDKHVTNVKELSIHPSGTIIAGTYARGIFLSTDEGTTWRSANQGIADSIVWSVACTPNGICFAATHSEGTFSSSDAGNSWEHVEGLLTAGSGEHWIQADSLGFIYVAGNDIYRSTDQGITWDMMVEGSFGSIAVGPGGFVYAGTNGGGLYRSSNRGENWTILTRGLEATNVYCLEVDSDGLVYVGTYVDSLAGSAVIRSFDNGETWQAADKAISNRYVKSLESRSTNSLLAGTHGEGIFYSADSGVTWMQSNLVASSVLTLLTQSNGKIFAGTTKGIFQTEDGGRNWTDTQIRDLSYCILSVSENILLAGQGGGTEAKGVLRSSDDGVSWEQTSLGNVTVLDLASSDDAKVLAGCQSFSNNGGIYRSTNSGTSWAFMGLAAISIRSIAFRNNQEVYAGSLEKGVYRSTNGGITWAQSTTGLGEVNVYDFAFLPGDAVLCGTSVGLYLSTNSGISWSPFGLDSLIIRALFLDQMGTIFVGTADSGIFSSPNEGANFYPLSSNLFDPFVRTIARQSDGTLFAGTNSNGVFLLSGLNLRPLAATLRDTSISDRGRGMLSDVTFYGTESLDPEGSPIDLDWYVDRAFVNTGPVFSHEYQQGTSEVMLIVTDSLGASDTSTATVNISAFSNPTNGPIQGGLSMLGDNVLYATASGDAVYRMDGDGNIYYALEVGGDILSASSLSHDTTIYIASTDRNLYAFSKYGAPVWPALPLGGKPSSTPTIDSVDNRLYVGVQNRNFFAINRSTGQVAWSYFANAPITSSAVITSDRKLIFATSKGSIYGFDLADLPAPIAPTWFIPGSGDSIFTSPCIDDQGFLYFGTKSGTLIKVSMVRGESPQILWNVSVGSSFYASPVVDADGILYVGSIDSKVYAIDTYDGSTIWTYTTSGSIRTTPAISNSGRIYVGNEVGELLGLRNEGNSALREWYYKHGAGFGGSILCHGDMVYAGGMDGKIVGFYNPLGAGRADISGPSVPIWGTFQGNNQRTGIQAIHENLTAGSVRAGWNLVSLSVNIGDDVLRQRQAVFPTSISPAFSFQLGYSEQDVLTNGIGYWLKFDRAQIAKVIGDTILIDSIAVVEGWNLIGSVTIPIHVATVLSDPPSMTTSQFFDYTGRYETANYIRPGRGYWVKASQAGTLILSAGSQATAQTIRIIRTTELPPPPPDEIFDNVEPRALLPGQFQLQQNFPNPFNPSTVIQYQLPIAAHVRLSIHNTLGSTVMTLVDEQQSAGSHSVTFDAADLPSGVYLYRLNAGSYTETKKLVVVR